MAGSTLLAACAHPAATAPKAPTAADSIGRSIPSSLEAPEAAARVRLAAFSLAPTRPVLIDVAPTRAAFEERTGVRDPLVRAWTVFDVVTLAPVSTWQDTSSAALTARLTHELCHAAIEQRFGTIARARAARIPRFFEEGACSVVAEQSALRLSLTELRALSDEPTALSAAAFAADPVRAYAAAHHFMSEVRARHGDGVFAAIADAAAADGAPGCVERALEVTLGASVDVVWRTLLDSRGRS